MWRMVNVAEFSCSRSWLTVSAFVVLGRVRLFDRCLVVVEVDGTVGSEVERAAGVVVVGVGISSSPVEGGELGEVGVVV
jgi:hypothetical protein